MPASKMGKSPPARPNPYIKRYNETEIYGKDFRRYTRNPYRYFTLAKLQTIGKRYKITNLDKFEETDLITLSVIINTCYLLEHPYLSLPVPDLRREARSRNMKFSSKAARKPDLVALLEQADDNLTFRFTDLPPELRERIYRFAFLQVHALRRDTKSRALYQRRTSGPWLKEQGYDYAGGQDPSAYGTGNGELTEHAVTRVSRQLRHEALPVFYQTRRFSLGQLDTYQLGPMRLTKQYADKPWVARLSSAKLARIRCFSVIVKRVHCPLVYLDIDFIRDKGVSRYKMSWWSSQHLAETDPPGGLAADPERALPELAKHLRAICQSQRVGRLSRDDILKLQAEVLCLR